MNCPVCKRELAPTLSICLTCGAMMNDSVREELETKIGKLIHPSPVPTPCVERVQPPLAQPTPKPPQPALVQEVRNRPRPVTAELPKRNTSPTLIEFQTKNSTLPDWRLQLQNSIRRRNGNASEIAADRKGLKSELPPVSLNTATVGKEPELLPVIRNEKVVNALKRIEESRRNYSGTIPSVSAPSIAQKKPSTPDRSFPFNVVEAKRTTQAPSEPRSKPKALNGDQPSVSPLRIEKKKFDTNKLPPIPEPEVPLSQETVAGFAAGDQMRDRSLFRKLLIRTEADVNEGVEIELPNDEIIDDLAPLSMRFGAAVFDLIIGGFASAILLSPFLLSGAELASISGVLALGGAALLVMFIYLTATIAYFGRTFGMRLFALEIIDVEANELPTLHQAAVNSAAYLLSLLFGGIGFIPALFTEDRRTIHDMLSGTILIREY